MTSGVEPRRWAAGIIPGALPVLWLLAGCSTIDDAGAFELRGPTMGTTWSVKIVAGPGELDAAARKAIDQDVRDLLVHVEGLMSTWDPASELSRFNQFSSTDPFPVSRETFEVFQWAVA